MVDDNPIVEIQSPIKFISDYRVIPSDLRKRKGEPINKDNVIELLAIKGEEVNYNIEIRFDNTFVKVLAVNGEELVQKSNNMNLSTKISGFIFDRIDNKVTNYSKKFNKDNKDEYNSWIDWLSLANPYIKFNSNFDNLFNSILSYIYHFLKGDLLRTISFKKWKLKFTIFDYKVYKEEMVLKNKNFETEAFLQLAKVLKLQGNYDLSEKIIVLMKDLVNKTEQRSILNIRKPFMNLYGVLFDYGLSIQKALVTFFLYWSIGVIWIFILNTDGHLVVDSTPTATYISAKADPIKQEESYSFGTLKQNKNNVEGQVPCGKVIHPTIYALDLMIPLIDHRQEFRCMVRTDYPKSQNEDIKSTISYNPFDFKIKPFNFTLKPIQDFMGSFWSNFLLFINAVYTILGWIITSLLILTFTRISRRHID